MTIEGVFLPKNPEAAAFDAVDAVCRAVKAGCKLHIRKSDGQWAFLPRRSDPKYWTARGWVVFGLHVRPEDAPCAA